MACRKSNYCFDLTDQVDFFGKSSDDSLETKSHCGQYFYSISETHSKCVSVSLLGFDALNATSKHFYAFNELTSYMTYILCLLCVRKENYTTELIKCATLYSVRLSGKYRVPKSARNKRIMAKLSSGKYVDHTKSIKSIFSSFSSIS